jgi:type III secretion system YscQ/HrcQ family protein
MTAAPAPDSTTTRETLRPYRTATARPEFVRISNDVAGKKRSLRFAWNGQPAELEFTALKHSLVPKWTARIQLAGHGFTVHLHHMPELGWMAPELAGVDITVLPEELALSALQSCLADVVAALAKAGVEVSVNSFVPFKGGAVPSESLAWAVSRGTDVGWLRGTLSGQDTGWQHLASLIAQAPANPGPVPEQIPFPITVIAGSLRCGQPLLKELELQDVLLAEVRGFLAARECFLLLRGRPFGIGQANGSSITIKQVNLNGTHKMAETTKEPAALDELEVELTFVVGQKTVTLGELRTLAPGASFELGAPIGEAVTIHANGRPIGKGELLEVGDRVGVRITELK